MARQPDPTIRKKLLKKAIDYVYSHGMSELSLRPLAKALKTSARMLLYHFGSREGLMHELLEGIREREDARVEAWFRSARRPRTMAEFVQWYWKRLSSPGARSTALLVFEIYALALRHPRDYPGVLQKPVGYWKRLVTRSGVPAEWNDATATLLLAATRGLLLDLTATGDRARIVGALHLLVNCLP
jgi:AcrR family transcriptional regulator